MLVRNEPNDPRVASWESFRAGEILDAVEVSAHDPARGVASRIAPDGGCGGGPDPR